MTKKYQIRFNVYASSLGIGSREFSLSGHINVTLAENDRELGTTYGANLTKTADKTGAIFRGEGDTVDGIIQDESEFLNSKKRNFVTRTVPVTEEQYFAIKKRLEGAKGKKYDYAILPGKDGQLQACASFAAAVYKMTGHPLQVGALFSGLDRKRVNGSVWNWLPVVVDPEHTGGLGPSGVPGQNLIPVPLYRPKKPISHHDPDTENLGVEIYGDEARFGIPAEWAEENSTKRPEVSPQDKGVEQQGSAYELHQKQAAAKLRLNENDQTGLNANGGTLLTPQLPKSQRALVPEKRPDSFIANQLRLSPSSTPSIPHSQPRSVLTEQPGHGDGGTLLTPAGRRKKNPR